MPLCRDKTKRAPQWWAPFQAGWETVIKRAVGRTRSKDYACFRNRVKMVSFETLRTFEMVLAVSLTRLNSRLMSKDSLVESLTINEVVLFEIKKPLDEYEDRYLWEYAPGVEKSRALSR